MSEAQDAFIIFDEAYEGADVDAFYLGKLAYFRIIYNYANNNHENNNNNNNTVQTLYKGLKGTVNCCLLYQVDLISSFLFLTL